MQHVEILRFWVSNEYIFGCGLIFSLLYVDTIQYDTIYLRSLKS